jgi:hypothetical protein
MLSVLGKEYPEWEKIRILGLGRIGGGHKDWKGDTRIGKGTLGFENVGQDWKGDIRTEMRENQDWDAEKFGLGREFQDLEIRIGKREIRDCADGFQDWDGHQNWEGDQDGGRNGGDGGG